MMRQDVLSLECIGVNNSKENNSLFSTACSSSHALKATLHGLPVGFRKYDGFVMQNMIVSCIALC